MTTRCVLDRLRVRVRYCMSEYDYAYDSTYLWPRTITITSTQRVQLNDGSMTSHIWSDNDGKKSIHMGNWQKNGEMADARTNEQTNKQTNKWTKVPLCSTGHRLLWGCCQKKKLATLSIKSQTTSIGEMTMQNTNAAIINWITGFTLRAALERLVVHESRTFIISRTSVNHEHS